jgi:hypothetical protein
VTLEDDKTQLDAGGSPERPEGGARSRMATLVEAIRALVDAIRDGDDAMVESAVVTLSGRRRYLAPLGMVVGAIMMLFEGLRLLFRNWRLMLVQVLPAMWIWVAMMDLKIHMFHGKSFHPLHGWALVFAMAGVVVITAASSFLNAVFAFAIARPGKPQIRPAFAQAWSHARVVLGAGFLIGLALAYAALYVSRWGHTWFAVSMSIVIGVMMISYVSLPARLIGMKTSYSSADKLKASAVGGAIGAVVCFPPYALGRIGILMLGSHILFIPGVILLTLGLTLQVGATSSVKAIKMSAKLVAGRHTEPTPA